ncbi:TonB-dependent receptor [uncultured Dokdonia sp.]|uniref:TonB-dependent receptor n=1 Tax=uncultured Dokdonia sp. TaxID=575653 RepID=UPI0030EF10F9|tara:strand:+ start:91418 stop:93814 length:2397 start_codon:yes stop_codon:yes gene_type:complete
MKFYLWLSISLLSIASTAQECTYTLSGYIIDLHDNEVLSGATIIVAGSEDAVMTDSLGKYVITGLCANNYTLQVSHPACETQIIKVDVSRNTTRNINMEHHLESLGDVQIVAHAHKSKSRTATEAVVNHSLLESNSAASLGDALKNLSGVTSLNTGNSVVKPVIQGLHSSRVVLITEGTRLQDQEWGVEHAPNIDVNAAGEVTVIKGAAGLQYGGDAIGGTIIIEPEQVPVKDTIFGRTIITGATNGRGGSITTSLIKSYNNGWYGGINGTLKRFGDFEAPDYVLSNTALYERDLSVRIGVNKYRYGVEASYSIFDKESGILRSSHVGNAADLSVAINSQEPFVVAPFTYDINAPRQEVKHQIAKLKSFYRFDNFGKLSAQYDYQRNNRLEFDIRRDSDDLRPSIDLQLETVGGKIDFDYTADNTLTAKIGVSGRYQKHFPDPSTGVRRLIPDYQAQDFGVYALASKDLGKWTIEAGARYDYNRILAEKFYTTSLWEERGYNVDFAQFVRQEFDNQIFVEPDFEYKNISATAGVSYQISDASNISFNYALASRSPNVSELFSDGLHQSAARIELGDLSFNQEVANKISLNFTKSTDTWSFTIAPFANFIEDFILIEPTGVQQTIRGSFPVWEYRQTQARLLGFDIDNNVQVTDRFEFSNQFSLVKGKDVTLDNALINMPSASTRNTITYRIPEVKNLKLSLESNYVFRQNEFPDTNFDVFIPETNTTELLDISTPPDAYHLINFKGSVDFTINDKSDLNVGLMVNNLFDTSYREYLNRQRYFADDLGRNILLQLKINY